ncbi:Uncharacterised protein [Bordetella pertussis]|nr:Uncharacterised protein [Bordetella pertussis]
MPPCSMMEPAKMNSGMASRTNESMPITVRCTSRLMGRSLW